MQHTNSTSTARHRLARFTGAAIVATTAIVAFGSAAHADGTVDAADFLIWQRNTAADFNADGTVDAADFLIWQRNTAADAEHDQWIIIQSMSSPISP